MICLAAVLSSRPRVVSETAFVFKRISNTQVPSATKRYSPRTIFCLKNNILDGKACLHLQLLILCGSWTSRCCSLPPTWMSSVPILMPLIAPKQLSRFRFVPNLSSQIGSSKLTLASLGGTSAPKLFVASL